jgi:hypothetical protein
MDSNLTIRREFLYWLALERRRVASGEATASVRSRSYAEFAYRLIVLSTSGQYWIL